MGRTHILARSGVPVLAALVACGAVAAVPGPAPAEKSWRFAPEIEAFARRDMAPAAARDATLFIGSSSIRLWDTAHSFPDIGTVNRGFGGATTADVLHYYDRVVPKYQPASVVVYVGENDLAAGASPDPVASEVLTLLGRIRADFPKARIVYLSIKPSPARWTLWPKMAAVNAALKARAGRDFDYLDVGSALLTPEGAPDMRLFGMDGLHLNTRGYARWTAIVDAYLERPAPLPSPKPAAIVAATS